MSDMSSLAKELASIEMAARMLRERFAADRVKIAADLHTPQTIREMGALCRKAQAIYAGRRKRDVTFAGLDLFSEPAWDLLLDLFVANHCGRLISVTSAILASQAPGTTGLRWINRMIDDGLISREGDPADARRSHVCLTEIGLSLVAKAVAAA